MVVLITFLSLSCVNAQDLNASDADVSLDDSAQPVELSLDDTLEVASDEEALLAGSENQQQTTPEVISSNSKSSSYLILDNDADKENIHIGDVVVWTVSVINLGPDMAKNVKVIDKLPSGLKYIKHIASKGTFNPSGNITRAEAVTIFNNYLFRGELYTKGYNYSYNFETNYNHGGNYTILRFTDLSTNHWAYGHIMEATNNHRYEN